jgi:Spy/CpxP family protein refolding chaperone
MNTSIKILAAGLAASVLMSAAPASADVTDLRQANQSRRIDQGIRSGQLTPRETAKLDSQQAYIRDLERRFKADGVLTPRERAELAAAQNAASHSIYREKHDSRNRWSQWRPRWWQNRYGYGHRHGYGYGYGRGW